MNNLDDLEKAYQTAEQSSGSAQKEQENYARSIQYSIDQAKASLQELATDVLDSQLLKSIVDLGTQTIQLLDKIVQHPLLALLLGGGLAVGIKKLISESATGQLAKNIELMTEKTVGYTAATKAKTKADLENTNAEIQKTQAEIEDVSAIEGETVATEEENVTETTNIALNKADAASEKEEAVSEFTSSLTSTKEATATALEGFTEGIASAPKLLGNLAKGFGSVAGAAAGATSAIVTFLATNPVGWCIDVALALGALYLAYKKAEKAEKEFAEQTKKTFDEFKTQKDEIDSYKSKIEELYDTINNSDSVEDVTNTRKELLTVQDELIDKYGEEDVSVNLLTDSLRQQKQVLEELNAISEKQWRETRKSIRESYQESLKEVGLYEKAIAGLTALTGSPSFGLIGGALGSKGFIDNSDGVKHAISQFEKERTVTLEIKDVEDRDFAKKLAKRFGAEFEVTAFDLANNIGGKLKLTGNAEELEKQLSEMQKLISEDESLSNSLSSVIDKEITQMEQIVDNYKDFYNQYVLNERIFGTNYEDNYMNYLDAADKYKEALISGEQEAINENKNALLDQYKQLQDELSKDSSLSDTERESILKAFSDAVPGFQSILDQYDFEVNILPKVENASSLKGLTEDDIYKMLGTEDIETSEQAFEDIKNNLDEAGKLTGTESEKIQQVIDLLIQWGILQEKVTEEVKETAKAYNVSDEISLINTQLNSQMDAIANAYNTIFNGENGYDLESFASDNDALNSLRNAFTNLSDDIGVSFDTSAIDDFFDVIGDGTATIEQTQQAFDDLVTSYLYSTDVLQNLNEENKKSVQLQLKKMGITNAEEIVEKALGDALEYQRIQEELEVYEKENLVDASGNLRTATYEELDAFLKEKNASEETRIALLQYYAAKWKASDLSISTAADIQNLQALVSGLGGATSALIAYYNVKSKLESLPNQTGNAAIAIKSQSNYNELQAKAQKEIQDALNKTKAKVNVGVNYSAPNTSSSNSGGGGGSSSEPKEETYDWIETKIQRIEREITNLDKIVNRTWISWSDRNKALADELSKVEEEIGVQESAYERYMAEANSVGLSEDYAEKVKNGLIDLETITDEALKSQIDGYKGYYEQALSASDSVEDLRDKIYDLLKLDFDNVIKRWNIELEKFQHNLDIHNTVWDGLSDIRKVTPDMIHGNYYVQRVNLSEQIGKKETEITEMTAKRNAMIVRGITGEALDEIDAEIRNAQKELVEYTTEYAKQTAQIYIDLFENVQNKFDEIVNDIDHTSAKLKSYQSINEAAGYATSSYLLERLRDEAEGIVYQKQEELIALKQQLEEAVSTGAIEEGSKEWYEMANAIEKVKEEELEAIATSADLTKQLRELDWAKFDEVKTAIEKVKSDNDFLIELLQAETESFEENGSFNNVSNSVLALRSANLQVFKSDADYLKNEIDKYEKMLAENPGDQTLRHHLQDLKDELQDVTKSFKEERQAIIDYWKEHYDTMQKYLDKLINKRKEYLQNEKDIYDYQKNVSKQADDIASIQKQLMAYSGDETEEGKAKRQKLQKSLEDAQEQLEETEYERWKQDQETMLDKLSEDFGDYVETAMKDTNGLIEKTNILITENSDTISKTIQGVVDGNNNKITGPLAGIETALSTGTFGYNYTNVLDNISNVLGTIATKINAEYDIVNQKSKIDEERVNDSEKAPVNAPRTTNSMYRLYDPNSGSHFYTTDQNERDRLISSGWTDEGELGKAFENGAIPISRLFNPNNGDHLYTINSNEVDALKNAGWSYEGTIGYASDDDSGEPVYRLYNPNTGLHNFTMDENERDYLRSLGWVDEDVAWKMARFAKGGELVKGTGEDGFVLGRAGEHILSLDQIKEMKGVMKAYNPLAEAIKGATGISGLVGNSVDSMAITFNLPNVTNYNEFQNALKNDPDFYNWMAEATVGQLAGHNSLSRYKF